MDQIKQAVCVSEMARIIFMSRSRLYYLGPHFLNLGKMIGVVRTLMLSSRLQLLRHDEGMRGLMVVRFCSERDGHRLLHQSRNERLDSVR